MLQSKSSPDTEGADGELSSDKDLLAALSLTESHAARVLGRTRQSLYQARLDRRTDYFKDADIRDLVFAAKAKKRDLDLTAVIRYVTKTRGRDAADLIEQVNAGKADDEWLSAYEELWVVVPEVSWMYKNHPASMDMLIRLGARSLPQQRVCYFTAGAFDHDALIEALENQEAVSPDVRYENWMSALPPLIIGDPRERADIFLFTSGHFASNDWYGGRKLAALIQTLMETSNDLKPSRVLPLKRSDA